MNLKAIADKGRKWMLNRKIFGAILLYYCFVPPSDKYSKKLKLKLKRLLQTNLKSVKTNRWKQ
jgi:hypothetical protein